LGERRVKLFIDECLSPQLAIRLNKFGRHDAIHPLHMGRRGEPDYRVLQRCVAEDRVVVTENARDFRRLLGKTKIHPGLIILPSIDREGTWRLLQKAIAYLEALGDPADVTVNHVLEIDEAGAITLQSLPSSNS
jgi:predicted nuclease of predicted toxin-antitoxin system